MKTLLRLAIVSLSLTFAHNASAFFWDNDDWECMGPFGDIPGCNPYDEWDPRYWMEEMEQAFDNDDYYGPRGGYGGPYGGYGSPYGGYGSPYGGGYGGYGTPYAPPSGYVPQQPAPVQRPAPVPQYVPAPAPQYAPAPR